MKDHLLLTVILLFFAQALWCQVDTAAGQQLSENILTATLKAREVQVDLSNPEEAEFALKKIHTFRYLESLILEGETEAEHLKKLFYRVSVLRNITSVSLKDNDLTRMPESIAAVKTLRSLCIEGNADMDYAELFTRLKGLPVNDLKLVDNDLKAVPATIGELKTITRLQISGSNQLDYTALVEELAKLPSLTTLCIPVNYIAELPPNIGKLKSLQVLDVSNNNLLELPQEVSGLKAINNLSIHGNLLLNPVKDLEKLKGNPIQYLSLDKEISGEDLEQIKKMFPDAQIDFPVNKEEEPEAAKAGSTAPEPVKPVYSGELKTFKEAQILSGAYLVYGDLFQGTAYNFDTLNFEQRYKDLRYENTFEQVSVDGWRSTFYFRNWLRNYEKPGKRKETWFYFGNDISITAAYPELLAFSGMYWVYTGGLSKKQFKRTYIRESVRPAGKNFLGLRRRKRSQDVTWRNIRVEFSKNNSQFIIEVKNDSGFFQFTAYPVVAGYPLDKIRPTYTRRYSRYQKMLMRRSQRFNRDQLRSKAIYDLNYNRIREYAWKELQRRMSNEEKAMSKEEWLLYYDNIIANELEAIDHTALSMPYIRRALLVRGYKVTMPVPRVNLQGPAVQQAVDYGARTINVDFVDSKSGGKLAVTNIFILDTKNKQVMQINGTVGLAPNVVTLRQFASYSLIVELRNGNWGYIQPEEIDGPSLEEGKIYKFKTFVYDKNLDTIGDLFKGEAR